MAVTINDKERVHGLAVKQGNALEIHQRAAGIITDVVITVFVAEGFGAVEQMRILSI